MTILKDDLEQMEKLLVYRADPNTFAASDGRDFDVGGSDDGGSDDGGSGDRGSVLREWIIWTSEI